MIKEIHVTFTKGVFFVFVVSIMTFSTLTFLVPIFNEILNTDFSTTNLNSNIITGMVPNTFIQTPESITPSFSDSDFEGITQEYDGLLMDACRSAHYRAGDCFYLMKSIMSVTSRGNPNFVDGESNANGLIPLNYQLIPESQRDEINADDLFIPEVNVVVASRYLMRLYDVYNGDLAFTALAYYAGRGITNEIMYSFQRSIQSASSRDVQITTSRIFSELDDIYMKSSTLIAIPNLRQKNDVKQFYIDVLSAYHFWTNSPISESSTANLLFDTGTYSIRPSFSASINYNIREIHHLRNLLNEFISSPLEKNFEGLKDFLIENNDGEILENGNVKTNQFVWSTGSCINEHDVFERYLQRFIDCIDYELDASQESCYCDFSGLLFDDTDYSIRISFERNTEGVLKEVIKIQLLHKDEVIREESITLKIDGYFDDSHTLRITRPNPESGNIERLMSDNPTANSNSIMELSLFTELNYLKISSGLGSVTLRNFVHKYKEGELTNILFVRADSTFNFGEACGTRKQFEKICVENVETKVYNKNANRYTPIQYSFALAVDPMELGKEEYNLGVEDIDSFTATVNDRTITINPASACSEPNCFEDIIFGKPISYSNRRENIMIVSLDEKTILEARNKFTSLLSSERTFEDWIDEKHRVVHFLIDENGIITKLAREDAIVQFSRCFDGNSIYIGLVGDSNKYSDIQMNSLAKLSYEIALRNEISPSRINLHNYYRENELSRRPNSFPADYSCDLNSKYDIHESSVRAYFNSVLLEIIRTHNDIQETQEPEIQIPAGLVE